MHVRRRFAGSGNVDGFVLVRGPVVIFWGIRSQVCAWRQAATIASS